MQINEDILKLTGKVSLVEPLELGYGYKVEIDGEVTSVTDSDRGDGTKDRIYKFEPLTVEVIDKRGQMIKTRDPKRVSQQIRLMLHREWQQDGRNNIEFEELYKRLPVVFLKIVPRVYELLIKELEN